MRQALAELPVAAGLSLRIGIDSGAVVAGVIGRTIRLRPLGRYRQHGEQDGVSRPARRDPGTERTYRRLEDSFVLEERTGVVVKGKGEMTTYILLGERPEPSVAGTRYEPASSR